MTALLMHRGKFLKLDTSIPPRKASLEGYNTSIKFEQVLVHPLLVLSVDYVLSWALLQHSSHRAWLKELEF